MKQDLSPDAVRARRRLIFRVLLSLFVLFGALALFLVLGWSNIRDWRAQQLAAKALAEIEAGRWESAQSSALAAYRLSPGEPESLRAVARVNAAIGNPQTADFLRVLIDTGHAQAKDYALYAVATMRQGQFQQADDLLRKAEGMEPDALDTVLGRADYYAALRNFPALELALEKAVRLDPTQTALKFRLGQLLASSGDPGQRVEGVRRIKEVAGLREFASLPALAWLAQSPLTDAGEKENALARMRAHPQSGEVEKLQSIGIEMTLHPDRRDVLLDALIVEYRKKPPESQVKLGSWLTSQREYSRARELLPLQVAMTRKDFFLIWLDATSGMGDWEEVRRAIDVTNVPLEPALASLYRGRVALEEGDLEGANRLFERSVSEASHDTKLLWYLAGYFQFLGKITQSEKALRALTNDPSASRQAYGVLVQQYASRPDTDALLALLDEMSARWPSDAAIQNDNLYLRLLLDRGPADAVSRANKLLDASPDKMPPRATLALAYLCENRPSDALELFEKSGIPLGALLPGQAAVFAKVLAANGMMGAARNVAKGIPTDRLRAEERALIQSFL